MQDHDRGPLRVHRPEPLVAETALGPLMRSAITPQDAFFVRCHGAVPAIDPETFRLRIAGRNGRERTYSLRHLRDSYAIIETTAFLQCAGNRRADLQAVAPTSGDPWSAGAIGNARWTGIRLADLLREVGVTDGEAGHATFTCRDDMEAEGSRFRFGVSIPLAKAMAPEVLVAFAMNGEPLTPEHGFPLRVVVHGFAGIRSAKWVEAITVGDAPADTPVQRRDYRLFPPGLRREEADLAGGFAIDAMPVNAAICEPAASATLPAGPITVRGWAAASGRAIARVDVSPDGGRSWVEAALDHDPASPWAWTLWRAELILPAGTHELAVRAVDAAGQTQPSRPEEVWNFKGYLSSAWHRITVEIA